MYVYVYTSKTYSSKGGEYHVRNIIVLQYWKNTCTNNILFMSHQLTPLQNNGVFHLFKTCTVELAMDIHLVC